MNASQFSAALLLHTKKLIVYVEKCPFCYGNDICALFDNNEISYTNLTISEKTSNLINVKNVYIANYNNSKVVLKKLGHNWELTEIDNIICKDQTTPEIFENCPPYQDCYTKDFTTNIVEYLTNNDISAMPNLKLCSNTTLNYFVNNIFSLYTKVNISVMTANIWTTLLANVEPIMLQILNSNDGWPVPKYFGACGRIIVEEYSGKSLHNTEEEPWIIRANLALQLLKAANDFTNKHAIFRFYLTDISSDNILVTDNNEVKFVDLENMIIAEKFSEFDIFGPHESENFDCDNCYAFSQNEICEHSISDHNFYSVCKLLLSENSPWPMMQNGLLHTPPKQILETYPDIFNYIEICAQSSQHMNRFEASKKLINLLELIVSQGN